ncbi:MAG: hypothetical protein J07HR59_00152 [Halorubrum sp. J07HR59]|nr:MAG: hypothetical protein J07HR59_00152 [Halorubrum sp. J07HR59]
MTPNDIGSPTSEATDISLYTNPFDVADLADTLRTWILMFKNLTGRNLPITLVVERSVDSCDYERSPSETPSPPENDTWLLAVYRH